MIPYIALALLLWSLLGFVCYTQVEAPSWMPHWVEAILCGPVVWLLNLIWAWADRHD